MKHFNNRSAAVPSRSRSEHASVLLPMTAAHRLSWFCVCALLGGLSSHAATLPSDWQREQPFNVTTSGLIKLSLPVETLDAARPALEDLRLYDDAGDRSEERGHGVNGG